MDHFIYSHIVCRFINFLWWKMIRFYDYERFVWGVLFTTWNEWKGRCRPYTLLLANVLFIIGRPGRDYGNTNDSWLSWIRSVNKVMFIGFLYQSFTDDGVLVANGKWGEGCHYEWPIYKVLFWICCWAETYLCLCKMLFLFYSLQDILAHFFSEQRSHIIATRKLGFHNNLFLQPDVCVCLCMRACVMFKWNAFYLPIAFRTAEFGINARWNGSRKVKAIKKSMK